MPSRMPFFFCMLSLLPGSAEASEQPARAFARTLAAAEAGDLATFERSLSRKTLQAMKAPDGVAAADWFQWSAAVIKESLPLETVRMRRGWKRATIVTQRVDMDGKPIRFRMVRESYGWKLDLQPEMVQWQRISRDLHEAIENMRKATPLLGRELLPSPCISP